MRNNLKKLFTLFLVATLFIKLPSFYLIPSTQNVLLASHTIAKFIFYLIFPYSFFGLIYRKDFKKNDLIFIFLFFIVETSTVLVSQDIFLFLKNYQDIVANIAIFVSALFFCSNFKESFSSFYKLIIVSASICVFLDILLLILGKNIILYIPIQKELFSAYSFNIDRGRYSLNLCNGIFLPFLISFIFIFFRKDNFLKFYFFLLIVTILLLGVLSNFRGEFLQGLLGLILSVIFITKNKNINFKMIFLPFFLLAIIIGLILSNHLVGFNVIDRFNLATGSPDLESINFRITSAKISLEIFKSSPIIGTGVGSYQLFLNRSRNKFLNPILYNEEMDPDNPHNIILQVLAESGLLGILAFFAMLFYFIKKDLTNLSNEKLLPFIISSWLLFFYLLINPSSSIFFSGWFWFFRGVIAGGQYHLFNKKVIDS